MTWGRGVGRTEIGGLEPFFMSPAKSLCLPPKLYSSIARSGLNCDFVGIERTG